MDKVCARPDSCNGEFPWPRDWPSAPAGVVVVSEQGYVMPDGSRRNAHVMFARGPGYGPFVAINVGHVIAAQLGRGEAVILRDLLNEVLEATT